MFDLKYCPFCGGYIEYKNRIEWINSIETEVSCIKCGMNFLYKQNFLYSKDGKRIAMNNSFEEIWDNRIDNT